MASTFTATAQASTSTIGYANSSSSSWHFASGDGAMQGAYENTSAGGSRVGLMIFTGAAAALKGKKIKKITLRITAGGSGSDSNKTLTFCRSKKASYNGGTGSSYPGTRLGTLGGNKFKNNTSTHTLSPTSNAALFEAMAAYFSEGNQILVLYNGETSASSSGGSYSTNFCRLTSVTLTVEYGGSAVWYCDGGQIIECALYYCDGGEIVEVAPYYNDGGNIIEV